MTAKARPIARASAVDKVCPTIPRTSYSRRIVGSNSCVISRSSSAVGGQDFAQPRAELWVLQAERHRRLEKTELVAAIEPPAGEAEAVERLALVDQLAERVGELDFTPAAGRCIGEMAEHLGLDDVAADNRQGRRRLGRIGLFDEPGRAHQ